MSDDSWKHKSNFIKNTWNKELFGTVRKDSEGKKIWLAEVQEEHKNLSSEIGHEPEEEDPVTREEGNFWTARSATLNQINRSADLKFEHRNRDEIMQGVSDAGRVCDDLRPFTFGGEDALLVEAAQIYDNEVEREFESHIETKRDYSNTWIPQPPEKDEFSAEKNPLFNKRRPLFKLGEIMLGQPIINHDRDTEKAKGKSKKLPSVTSILKETMPTDQKLSLQAWEEKMVAQYGREGFERINKNTLLRGERLHYLIQQYFEYGSMSHLDVQDFVSQNHVKSIEPVLEQFARPPLAVESSVIHPKLGYKGYLDCVTMFYDFKKPEKSSLALIDWKTSGKPKNSLKQTFDNPYQIAAYVGAFNHDDRYPVRVQNGMIVVVYNDGSPATLLPIDEKKLEYYWKRWLSRLRLYHKMSK